MGLTSWRTSGRRQVAAPPLCLATLLLACATAGLAADEIDRQAMARRPIAVWTQAE